MSRPCPETLLINHQSGSGPRARPRTTNLTAILRLASSIISSPNMTAPFAIVFGGTPIGLEDVPCAVELLLGRRIDLVQHVDLVGCEGPLAVVTQDLRAHVRSRGRASSSRTFKNGPSIT